jgi:hypothetical protein
LGMAQSAFAYTNTFMAPRCKEHNTVNDLIFSIDFLRKNVIIEIKNTFG